MAITKFNAVAGFSVGETDYIIDVVDSNANVFANTLTVTSKTQLGSIANVKITGGSAGYVLKTDGTGNLSWANQSAGGVNTYVQFNDNGLFNGTSAFTFNKESSVLTLTGNLLTDNANLGNLATANYFTGTLTTASSSQPNITSVGSLTGLDIIATGSANLGNLATANYFTGTLTTHAQPNITSVGSLTGLDIIAAGSANLGNVATANYFTGTLTTNAQPNITSVGALTSLVVTGNISAANVAGGNLVSASYVQGTLITAAQPNITQVGTLTSLKVTGNTDIVGNLNVTGNITYLNSNVTYLVDPIVEQGGLPNGAVLSSNDLKDRGQLLHYYSDAAPVDAFMGWKNASGEFVFGKKVSVTENIVTVNEYGNIRANTFFGTLVGDASLTTLAVSGNIIAGNVDGGNLVKSTYLQGTLTTSAQPNITSVGLLSGLTVGNTTSNTIFGNGTIVATGNANVNNIGAVQGVFTGNVAALNANLGNLTTSNFYAGNGSLLSSITGANVTGQVNFAATANAVAGANVSGQVANALVAGTVYTAAQPAITSVGTLTSLAVTGNITSGNANLGNLTTSNFYAGNGSLLSSITGANVTGQVANALVAGTVYTAAQPAITSVGKLTQLAIGGDLVVDGNITVKGTTTTINSTVVSIDDLAIEVANVATTPATADGGGIIINGAAASMLYRVASNSLTFSHKISADGSLLTSLNATQVTGQVANALVAGTVYTAAQPAITSVGTLTALAVTGNITSGNATLGNLVTSNFFTGNGSLLSSITGANVTGQVNFAAVANAVAGANVTGEVAFAALANRVAGSNVTGQVNFAAVANAVAGANVSGQVANALVAGTVYTAAQPAITSVGTLTSLAVTGNITSGNANLGNLTTSNFYAGNGSLLSSITGANVTGQVNFAATANSVAGANVSGQVANALVAGTVYTAAQPAITSVGTLTGLFVSGDSTLTGNLTVTGTTTVVNSTVTKIVDPIIELGGTSTGSPLTTNDGQDRGELLHYYSGSSPVDAFMGWKNSSNEFVFASNVTIADNIISVTEYGNVHANTFIGNLVGSASLTNLTVTGNITSGNANLGNLTTSNFYAGNGSLLSSITGANVTGQVNFAATANSVAGGNVSGAVAFATTANAVAGANVSGQVNFAAVANSVAGANVSGQVNFAAVANSVAGANVSGQVANALVAGTVYTAAQPAITSVGTLTSLAVTGNITSGNANLGNLVTANFYSGDGGLLTNIAATSGTATTVSSSAQPNITSVGSLTGLVVSNASGVVNFTTTANVALGDVSNLHVTGGTTGQYLKTDGTGNLSWDTAKMYGASNITNVVAGSAIGVETIYTDPAYPSGKFMIYQLGPISMNVTDTWATGSATKNAYANSLAGSVNTQNITINLSLANATFNVSSSDTITLGGDTVITGVALTALGISGTGGTYTIPSSAFSSSTIQTRATSTVQVSLTTNRSTQSASGTTLVATQPVPFTVNSLSASFPSTTVPYWNLIQSFNWSASVTGSVASGNLTYTGGTGGTLTTTGATAGSSNSLDSTVTYTLSTSDYTGAGLYGYGTRTIPATVTKAVTPATIYYPLFYKITSSSGNPNFTTSDGHYTNNYTLGQGASTNTTTTDYLWIAIRASTGAHTFGFTFLSAVAVITPDASYTNQSIGGELYNVYGFTNANQVTFIYTTT